jgi:GAF domain-containing protein
MLRLFNLRHWPFWFKLTMTLAVVLLAALLLLVSAFEIQAREEADARLEDYLLQTALTRRERLEAELQNAFSTITEASTAAYLRPRLLRLLQITGTPSGADIVARSEATDLLNFRLVANGVFEYVRVLTPEGIVAASVFPADMPPELRELVGADSSQSPGYRGALDAQTLGEQQRLIVYTTPDGQNQAEVVQLIEFDEEIVGFMIGRLSLQNTLIDNITDALVDIDGDGNADATDNVLAIKSYLATRAGAIIADPSLVEYAASSARRSSIGLALAGQSGISQYLVGGVDAPVLGHYQPISGSPLALITDVANPRAFGHLTLESFGSSPWLVPALAVIVTLAVYLIWIDVKRPVDIAHRILDTGLEEEMQFELPTATRADIFGQMTRNSLNTRKRFQDEYESIKHRLEMTLRDIEATQEVGRFVTTQRDQEPLMNEVVNLIINVFHNIYHAQIFLVDKTNEFAVLRASTGEVGKRLLERGHRLSVGGTSVIGRTTGEGVVTAVLDTEASEFHHKNELLPNTRAELAIPLRLGKTIIGALDVQSFAANSFTDDQITTLQAMADQIAISIENARLYQESVRALDEIARQNRENTAETWREHLYGTRTRELVAWSGTPTRTETDGLREQAIKTGVTQIGGMTGNRTIPIAVPILLRGQPLGAVVWELPVVEYNDEKVALAEELVNRLSLTLDNARLFEESQRSADRERVLNEIASKITAQSDIESILTTAVREVGQALRTQNVKVRLGAEGAQRKSKNQPVIRLTPSTNGTNGSNGNGHHD